LRAKARQRRSWSGAVWIGGHRFYDFEVAGGDGYSECKKIPVIFAICGSWSNARLEHGPPAVSYMPSALEYFVTSSAQLARFHVTSEK
jgi:hypothetical protein